MSSTTTTGITTGTTTAPTTTPTTCDAGVYQVPTTDSACAVAIKSSSVEKNYTSALHDCCKDSKIQDYDHRCAKYCLAQEQSVGDLQKCLFSSGVKYEDVFCNANQSSTATASVTTSASETGKAGATGTKTGSENKKTDAPNAAAGAVLSPRESVSKAGVGLVAMMFCSAVLGVFA